MVAHCPSEVTRVALEVGTEGILGENGLEQVRPICAVNEAVVQGDLGNVVDVNVQGEMLDLKWTIDSMVLTDVKLMAMNLTNQVRSIAQVAKAVVGGDLTKKIEVDDNRSSQAALQVVTKDRLGGQEKVEGMRGIWTALMMNDNVRTVLSSEIPSSHFEMLKGLANEVTLVNSLDVIKETLVLGNQAPVPGVNGMWKANTFCYGHAELD
ncbi:hypothetical protein H0H92_004101 [Tricholoma furcatifolium]|nr:hypothetical protein H0H92_004101 [Tricholoma furcatifolium]